MYSIDGEEVVVDDWQDLGVEEKKEEPKEKHEEVFPLPKEEFDFTDLQEQYKVILGRAKATASALAALNEDCWDAMPAASALDHVQLYLLRDTVLRPLDCGSFFTIKAQGILCGRPERLAYAARDTSADCRKRWDTQLNQIAQWQTFVALNAHYITTRIFMPSNALVKIEDRWVGGLLLYDHHRSSDIYRIIFRSALHPVHGMDAPSGTRLVECLVGMFIQQMTPGHCKVSLFVDILQANAGSWLTTPAKERLCENLRSWMYELEQAVEHWDFNYKK